MTTPIPSLSTAVRGRGGRGPRSADQTGDKWRCTRCDKLLGVVRSSRLHVRFARGHQYIVALPATCTCRSCGTLNHLAG
jgi:hypothetical protein